MDWWHEDPELLSATLYLLSGDVGHHHPPLPLAPLPPPVAVDDDDDATSTTTPTSSSSSSSSSTPSPLTKPQQYHHHHHGEDSLVVSTNNPFLIHDPTLASPYPDSHHHLHHQSSPSPALPAQPQPVQQRRSGAQPCRAKRVVNVSRERQRDEIRYLRDKVVELDTELLALQARREQQLRPHLSDNGQVRSVAVFWEELATRQFRERKRSEVLNAKLRAMRETQLRIAEELINSIRKAEEQARLEDPEGLIPKPTKPNARVRLPIDISQRVSEEDQLRRAEFLCTQWQEAFSRCAKFSNPQCSAKFLDLQLVEDHEFEAVVDVYGSRALPFPVCDVEEIVWRYFLEESEEEENHSWAQDYENRDDTVIAVFRSVTTLANHKTVFNGKYVAKRFRNPEGHLVLVFQSYAEPKCVSNALDDVSLDEDCWVRVADSRELGHPPLNYPLTLIHHVRRLRIRFGLAKQATNTKGTETKETGTDETEETADHRRVGALTEFLMMQIEEEMKRGEQAIENMLLDSITKSLGGLK